jgi:ion channel
MLSIILSACVLVAATVFVHVAGIAVLLRGVMRLRALPPTHIWAITRRLLRMVWLLVLIHLAEISVWGLFYRWRGCLPDAEAAFYFSGVTYTTIGYGDLVLAKPWRLLGPIEGLMGILMFGLSTGFFFAVLTRVYQSLHAEAAAISNTERPQP